MCREDGLQRVQVVGEEASEEELEDAVAVPH